MTENTVLYPEMTANQTGFLVVSDEPHHEIYWEEYGNPDGEPVFVVHGGPGGGNAPSQARFFDPEYYRIILFDQRGAGKSLPFASLEENTTQHSVQDMIKLRDHLDIKGKMHLFGGSWGSTLSLVYAIHHPDTVTSMTLRGIFLCRKQDVDVFYQGDAADPGNAQLQGSGRFFPEAWKQFVEIIPEEERGDMIAAYQKRLTSEDESVRLDAARRWSVWEMSTCMLQVAPELVEKGSDPTFALPFARIENHYFMNGAFLSAAKGERQQNYILDNIRKVAAIPTEIVHGRYDMVCPLNQATDLVQAWQQCQPDQKLWPELHIVNDAGHSSKEPGIAAKLVEITDRFRSVDRVPTCKNKVLTLKHG